MGVDNATLIARVPKQLAVCARVWFAFILPFALAPTACGDDAQPRHTDDATVDANEVDAATDVPRLPDGLWGDSDGALPDPSDGALPDPSDGALPDSSDADDAVHDGSEDTLPDVLPDPLPDPVHPCSDPGRAPSHSPIALVEVFGDVLRDGRGDLIVDLVSAPVDGERWYAAQRRGTILTFLDDGEPATEVMDLHGLLRVDNPELGVMGLALHPQFLENRDLYVSYTAPSDRGGNHVGRISRFTLDADLRIADLASEVVVFEVVQPAASHNLNKIAFGPDGYLYAAIGDGGNPNDRFGNGQNPATTMGTIIRIDTDGEDVERGTAYRIPNDNPFVDDDAFAPEIWAWGLRNPWRITFDAVTGDLWTGDVGQDTWEELNRIERGENYGWPRREGPVCFLDEACDDVDALVDPVWAYTHSEGKSITSGFVYRGGTLSELEGHVFVADFISGAIWTVDVTGEEAVATLQIESDRNIATFAEDVDGELYVVHYAGDGRGRVYRVEGAAPPATNAFPTRLSETGCVDMADPLLPVDGAVAYAPAAELWSDGAEKARYFVLGHGGMIDVEGDGNFRLPPGTVIVKHFAFDGVPHETRLYIHHADGWGGYSYRWREDGSDADLLDTSFVETLPNGTRWVYPSRSQCVQCHTEEAGVTLGLEYLQLGRPYVGLASGPADTSQVASMIAEGLFDDVGVARLDDLIATVEPMPRVYEEGTTDAQARAYLHANCSGCHRTGSPTARGSVDFHYRTPFAEMNLCDEEPEHGRLYRPDGNELRIVIPGRAEQSIAWLRMETTNMFRMPPLATGAPDTAALDLVAAWIDEMEPCAPPVSKAQSNPNAH